MAGNTDTIGKAANWLLLIGGLNWGLAGVGGFVGSNLNVVNLALGSIAGGVVENIVYLLVGLSALWVLKGMFMK
jgi:uncharacterized membrane protein YuzA (DUF378 family)